MTPKLDPETVKACAEVAAKLDPDAIKCVGGHDRCVGIGDAECPYCEVRSPIAAKIRALLTDARPAQPSPPVGEGEIAMANKLAQKFESTRESYVARGLFNLSYASGAERDLIVAALRRLSAPAQTERNKRQQVVVDWGTKCFGADHMRDPIVRAARFFEEAAELVQAIGLPEDHAMRAFRHVYDRPSGDPEQEAGGVGVTLMALCNAVGLSADACETKEIARCLSKSPESFAARNQAKLQQVDAVSPAQSADSLASQIETLRRERDEALKKAEKLHIVAKNISHALMSFTPGGSEYFTRLQVGEWEDYYADADACQRVVRERIDRASEMAEIRAERAESSLAKANERVRELEEALRDLLSDEALDRLSGRLAARALLPAKGEE